MPNKPWNAGLGRGRAETLPARALEWSSVAIAMPALFLFGRALGAEGELHLPALAVGMMTGTGAFLAPWLATHLPISAPVRPDAGHGRYSEEWLLRRWPARRGGSPPHAHPPFDTPRGEG